MSSPDDYVWARMSLKKYIAEREKQEMAKAGAGAGNSGPVVYGPDGGMLL